MATEQEIIYDADGEFVYADTEDETETFREGWDSTGTTSSGAYLDDDAFIAELDSALRKRPERDDE